MTYIYLTVNIIAADDLASQGASPCIGLDFWNIQDLINIEMMYGIR